MEQALAGFRVLDLSEGIPGPYAAKLLADFGAEVVKVESPKGDYARVVGPFPDDDAHPERSALFLELNRNKFGITLDVFTPSGRALLDRLVANADALICSYSPAQLEELKIDYESFASVNPAIVITTITPWGRTGPYRDYEASEIVLDAFGHCMSSYGAIEREPLAGGGSLCQYYAGELGALSTLGAITSAEQSGIGQSIDLSLVEAQLNSMDRRSFQLVRYAYAKHNLERIKLGNSLGSVRVGFRPCKDGWVHPEIRANQFDKFVDLLGHPEWKDEPRFTPMPDKYTEKSVQEELNDEFVVWAADRTREEIIQISREQGLSIYPVNHFGDLLHDEHLLARGFWTEETHPFVGTMQYTGAPFQMSRGGYAQVRPAPLLGQHNVDFYSGRLGLTEGELEKLSAAGVITSPEDVQRPANNVLPAQAPPNTQPARAKSATNHLPLEGIRVLDMTVVWAGPGSSFLLGALGAEVIRVESLQHFPVSTRGFLPRPAKELLARINPMANSYPDGEPGEHPWNRFGGFNGVGINKLSATADLRRPEGVQIFHQLAAISDVVVDNNSFGVMGRLGIGYDDLRKLNPGIISISMPMFGNYGPNKNLGGMGGSVDAWGGSLAIRGYPDLDFSMSEHTPHMDGTTGPACTLAVLCALRERERTGEGQFIDFAQSENVLSQFGDYVLDYQWNNRHPDPLGNRDRWFGVQGCYRCSGDDNWLVLTVRTDEQWSQLAQLMGRPELEDEKRFATPASRWDNHDEIDTMITAWTTPLVAEQVMAKLQKAGIPAAKVMTEEAVFADPHVADRGFFVELTHPECGTHPYPGGQWKYSGTPLRFGRPAPTLGQDNEYIYKQLLGYSDEAYDELVKEKHIGTDYLVK